MNQLLKGSLFGLLSISIGASTLEAQTVEQFYRGKSITLFVPSGAGGVNDLSARLVARFLPRFLPGSPRIVVENVPGAGGLTLANRLFNTLPRDGSVLSVLERGTPQSAIAGDIAVKFDPLSLTWLGSLSSYATDAYLLVVNKGFPATSILELQGRGSRKVRLGASGPGATNRTMPLIGKAVFDLNLEVILGYSGAPAIALAQLRDEVDGQITSLSFLRSNQAENWASGKFRALMAFGRKSRHPDLPTVPTSQEMAANQNVRELINFAELPFYMALPIVAPPGLPEDRARALIDGFALMIGDPAFLAAGNELKLDMSPIGGAAVKKLISEAAATAPETINRYNEIIRSGN